MTHKHDAYIPDIKHHCTNKIRFIADWLNNDSYVGKQLSIVDEGRPHLFHGVNAYGFDCEDLTVKWVLQTFNSEHEKNRIQLSFTDCQDGLFPSLKRQETCILKMRMNSYEEFKSEDCLEVHKFLQCENISEMDI